MGSLCLQIYWSFRWTVIFWLNQFLWVLHLTSLLSPQSPYLGDVASWIYSTFKRLILVKKGKALHWVAMNMCELLWFLFLSHLHTVLFMLFMCYERILLYLYSVTLQPRVSHPLWARRPVRSSAGKRLSKYLKAIAHHELVAVRVELSVLWPKKY